MSADYPGIVQYHLGKFKQKPLPLTLDSYIITVAPRIAAFNEIYNHTKPNGGYYKYNWWKYYNAGQKQFVGFINRQERANQPWFTWQYPQFTGLFPSMNSTREYLAKQNVQINSDKTGNALLLMSKFDINFKYPPLKMDDRIYFTKGFKAVRETTVEQNILFKFETKNPNITLWIQENKYIQPRAGYEPIYFYLNYNNHRQFYYDITNKYSSVSLPVMNERLQEDTDHLNGMFLERINNYTSEIERIQIKNVLQYTDIILDSNRTGIMHFKEPVNKNYDIKKPFMMWLEDRNIRYFPLFIGFFNNI